MGKKDSDYSTASDSDSDASYNSKKGKKDKKGKDKDKKGKKDKKDKKDKDKSDKGKKEKDKKDKDKPSKEEKSHKKSPSHSDQYPSSSSASNPSHLAGPQLPSHSAPPPFPGFPTATSTAFAPQPASSHYNTTPQHPAAAARMSDYPPHGYGESPAPPPSGYRIPLSDDSPFPESFQALAPVAHDLDGSPIYLGSVLLETAVHPCKVGPNLFPHAMYAYGGAEVGHEGRYDMLPFVGDQMEWVPASHGRIPDGRRPVEGGYEEGGDKLYHSIVVINGVRVPGKTGEHL